MKHTFFVGIEDRYICYPVHACFVLIELVCKNLIGDACIRWSNLVICIG
jgi:hypothetical protein